MTNKRSLILQWAENGEISSQQMDKALAIADVPPNAQSWRQFVDQLLLWSGALALAFSAIFFFAFNWDALGRFAKFGLVEGLLVVALASYWKVGPEGLLGKVALMVSALLLGALMALYGQTYQTGADPWQLFAYWALLILPWVVVGRFAALWLLWVALINLSLFLYFSTFRGAFTIFFTMESQLLLAFAFNTVMLGLWEWGARHYVWLTERWAIRILAFASGTAITSLMLQTIFDWSDAGGWTSLLYPLWLAGFYFTYRQRTPDLFMLAGSSFSLIVVIAALLGRAILDHSDAGGFLLIALAVIGMSSAAAIWLKRIHLERTQ